MATGQMFESSWKAGKKKSLNGLDALLCLDKWVALKITPLAKKDLVWMSRLHRSAAREGLVKANNIVVFKVNIRNDRLSLCPRVFKYSITTPTSQKAE